MKTRIVRIGNSQGIRIPKPLLEQTGLAGEVEICVQNESLVIRTATKPRAVWGDAFRDMAAHRDDLLSGTETPNLSTWDEDEWEW